MTSSSVIVHARGSRWRRSALAACALGLALLAGCGGPRAEPGTVLLLEPMGATAVSMQAGLRDRAEARGFTVGATGTVSTTGTVATAGATGDAAGPVAGTGRRFRLQYRCDQVPARKRTAAHAVIDATVTDAAGTVVYRNHIVSAATEGQDPAMADALDTLVEDLARLR